MDNDTRSGMPPYFHSSANGPSEENVTISELDLYIGQKFLMIHDFGANHHIRLELINVIGPSIIDAELPVIVTSIYGKK